MNRKNEQPKQVREKYGQNVIVVNPKGIPPYQEIEDGYGFYGVLLEDIDERKVQCHICGGWFRSIEGNHIKKHYRKGEASIQTLKEYKKKFGFLSGTFLATRDKTKRHIKIGEKQAERMSKQAKENHSPELWEKLREANKRKKDYQRQAELKNRHGSCQAQLIRRLKDFVEKNGRAPKVKEVSWGCTARRRFGSWEEFCSYANVEPSQRRYTKKRLKNLLQAFIKDYGRSPSWRDFKDKALPSRSVFYHHWGKQGWKKALKEIEGVGK